MKTLSLFRRLALTTLALLLSACLTDDKKVIDPAAAIDPPGLTGMWSAMGASTDTRLYGDGGGTARYDVTLNEGQKMVAALDDIWLTPIPGQADAFVASGSMQGSGQEPRRIVFLIVARSNIIEVHLPPNGVDNMSAAVKAGVTFDDGHGRSVKPGSKAALMAYYANRAKQPFKDGLAFRRLGWFKTHATKDMDIAAAERALASGKINEYTNILSSLSSRGNIEAQFRLAGLFATGKGVEKDADTVMYLYESAHRGGHRNAAGALANFLTESGLSGRPGYEDALLWYAIHSLQTDHAAQASKLLHGAALSQCKQRPPGNRANSSEECAEAMVQLSTMRAEIAARREQTADEIVELAIFKNALLEKDKRIKREIAETKEKKEKNGTGDRSAKTTQTRAFATYSLKRKTPKFGMRSIAAFMAALECGHLSLMPFSNKTAGEKLCRSSKRSSIEHSFFYRYFCVLAYILS